MLKNIGDGRSLEARENLGPKSRFCHFTLVGKETLYRLLSFTPLFLAGFVGCGPWVKNLAVKLEKPWLEAIVMAVLLTVCTAYLVDGSFSPFLYFRF